MPEPHELPTASFPWKTDTVPKRKSVTPSVFITQKEEAVATADTFSIENGLVRRTFRFNPAKEGFCTIAFVNKSSGENYVKKDTEEFLCMAGDQRITGKDCIYKRHSSIRSNDEQTLTVQLYCPGAKLDVILTYIIYDHIPLVRKRIKLVNTSSREIPLTNLDIERLQLEVANTYMNEVYANFGTNLTRVPYKGDYNDAAVLLYNPNVRQGVLLGNESPSVLKRTEIYSAPGTVSLGLSLITDPYPFKKWLAPADTFASPQTFMYTLQTPKWQDFFEESYQDFIREKLGVKLFQQKKAPFFMYNTWQPFFANINEKLLKECVDSLAGTETDLFIIDAGWYKRSGDFNADSSKFPQGMKPVCDYIRQKNMRVGVWFTISGVHAKSEVAQQHPQWLIKDKHGRPANLHDDNYEEDGDNWNSGMRTMSLGSPYYDHMKETIRKYVNEWGVSYIKLDLSVAHSAYVHDLDRWGDYESNPSKLYKDRESSLWVLYERDLQLMDELHAEFPDLLLDCTFEVWGRYNSIDYALVQHADYDWLTNFDFPPPAGPISIRQMNYDRSRVVPANTLLIGNQFMDFPNYRYVYFSMASASALMVGDPRKLTKEAKAFYGKWNSWFREMERKYQFSQYRQLYDIFDRPTDSNWDGCYRINTKKGGGILFFYRNNSADQTRTFKVPCVERNAKYRIYSHEEGKVTGIYSGARLMDEGIKIFIPTVYTAKVLAIEKVL
ncbi:alpha-galactosidase [Chitinophaga barathri]|nr:alpha-galactosidase [Chitinophaga barathri]